MSNRIQRIVVHWSASASPTVDVEAIRKMHLGKGWRDIGYHRVIEHPDHPKYLSMKGTLQAGQIIKLGRNLDDDSFLQADEVGAHALGFNWNSIGYCVVAGPHLPVHPLQLEAIRLALNIHIERYNIRKTSEPEIIVGHGELMATQCPGPVLMNLVKEYRQDLKAA